MHGCIHDARSDRVETDTLIRKLDCERTSDRLQSTLGEVRKACWQYPDRLAYKGCRNVDHMSEFLKTHLRHRELRHIEESCQVRLRCPQKIVGGVLGKGLGNKDARVVYQQIDSSKILNCGTHDMSGRFLDTNVAVHQFQIGCAVERHS